MYSNWIIKFFKGDYILKKEYLEKEFEYKLHNLIADDNEIVQSNILKLMDPKLFGYTLNEWESFILKYKSLRKLSEFTKITIYYINQFVLPEIKKSLSLSEDATFLTLYANLQVKYRNS